jgi:hypothetical protein
LSAARPGTGTFGRLGGVEVAVLTASALIGANILWFPDGMGRTAAGGVQLAFLLDAGLELGAVAAVVAIVRRLPGMRLAALAATLWTPTLARTLALAVAAFDVAVVALTVCGSAVTIGAAFLDMTPTWMIEAGLLLPVVYGAALGIEALARSLDLMAPVTWLGLIAEYALVVAQARLGPAVVPHLPRVGGALAVAAGAYAGLWTMAGVTALPNVAAHLARDQRPRAPNRLFAGWGVSFVLQASLLVLDLAVLGVVGLAWYDWPTASVFRQVRSQALLVDRTGALAVPLLVVLVWAFSAVLLWNASVNVRDALWATPSRDAGRAREPGPDGAALSAQRWLRRDAVLVSVLGAATMALCLALGAGESLEATAEGWLDPSAALLAFALPAAMAVAARRQRAPA